RADVLVAASIFLVLMLLVPNGILAVRYRHQLASCQNNLREWYPVLMAYSDIHDGQLPNIGDLPEQKSVACMFVPLLKDSGVLHEHLNATCPPAPNPTARVSFAEVSRMDPQDFNQFVNTLTACYAYPLGYYDEGRLRGLQFDHREPNNAFLPILADRPPLAVDHGDRGNSPSHGGRG